MDRTVMNDLVDALVPEIGAEDLMLASLQAMVSSEITVRRQQLNLTQKDFAKMLNVSQSLVSRWENGDENFTLKTLVDIASKLNITMQSPFKLSPAKAQYFNNGKVAVLNSLKTYQPSGHYLPLNDYAAADVEDDLKEM
ncbi:MAG: helix-turn-helix transcriptional regulator [Clostridia bacterium]|nr:helix-turn-helix transcriptional regulator [Clostridia bacterium]